MIISICYSILNHSSMHTVSISIYAIVLQVEFMKITIDIVHSIFIPAGDTRAIARLWRPTSSAEHVLVSSCCLPMAMITSFKFWNCIPSVSITWTLRSALEHSLFSQKLTKQVPSSSRTSACRGFRPPRGGYLRDPYPLIEFFASHRGRDPRACAGERRPGLSCSTRALLASRTPTPC